MKREVMKRESSFYQNCQAMLNFGFVGKEAFDSPEVVALVVALDSQASVTLALKYHVYMVGEAAFSEGHGLPDQGVITSRVRSIEFENVRYADGVERKELHIWTDSGKYLAWCDDDGLTPEMAEMLVRIRAEKHSFADYVRYFTKISFRHPYYELTA